MAENFDDRSKPYWQRLPSSENPAAIPHQTPQCVRCRCCCSHPYSLTGVARAHSVHDHCRGLRNTAPTHFRCDVVPPTLHNFNVGSSIHVRDHYDLGNTIPSHHDHAMGTHEPHWNYVSKGCLCHHADRALSLECLNRTGSVMPTHLSTGQHFCAQTEQRYPCGTALQLEDRRVCERQHHHVRPLHWPVDGDCQRHSIHTSIAQQPSTNAHDHGAEVNIHKAEVHGNKRDKPSCNNTSSSQEPFDSLHAIHRQCCRCRNCSAVEFTSLNKNGEDLANMKSKNCMELPRNAPVNVSNARRNLTFVTGYAKDSGSNQYLLNSKDQTNPSLLISTDHLQLKAKTVDAAPRSVRAAKQQGVMLHQASSRLMDKPQMQVAHYFPPLDNEEENKRRLPCSDELVGDKLKARSISNGRNPEFLPIDQHISFENTNKCRSSAQESKLTKSQNDQLDINKLPIDLKFVEIAVVKPQSSHIDHRLDCDKDYSMSIDKCSQYAESVNEVTAKQAKTRQRHLVHTSIHKECDLGNAHFVTYHQHVDNASMNSDVNLRLQDDLSGVWCNPESSNSLADFPVNEPCSPIRKSDRKINSQHSTNDTDLVRRLPDRGVDIAIEHKNIPDYTALNVENCGDRKLQVQCNMKRQDSQQVGINTVESTSLLSANKGFLTEVCRSVVPELTIPQDGRLQSNDCDSLEIERPPPPYSQCGQGNGMLTSQENENCYQNVRENDSLAEVTSSTFKDGFHIGAKDCDLPGKEDCLIDFSDSTEAGSELPDSLSPSKHEVKQKMYRKEERVRYYPAFFKLYMEQHVENVMKSYHKRLQRRRQLEEEMEALKLSDKEKDHCREFLFRKESMYNRLTRTRMNRSLFETVTILGRGAFGDVSLVRRRDSGVLYAMKTLRKKDVFRRKQIAHVKAERDLLAEADSNWVVKLYYSFQDSQCLYFVMEYIAGGDLMGLLMKLKIFDHAMAQFYTAELVLAIESVHQLGYIHRDIKPDNILVGLNGHIKLTDFGLCTGFHWTHDSENYATMDPDDGRQQGNQRSQRNLARSLVGTPNYIAPEVLLQSGYTLCCDWWSVGVIVFEMLVGHPPFMSDTAIDTQLKVIHWRSALAIPRSANLSCDATDLIRRLCCDQSDRLGQAGSDEVKGHAFFRGIDFETLHTQTAPYIPQISHPLDTSNFDPVEPVRPGQSDATEPNNVFCDLIYDSSKHAFLDFTFRRFFDGTSEQ